MRKGEEGGISTRGERYKLDFKKVLIINIELNILVELSKFRKMGLMNNSINMLY